jgi:antitoxin CptB
MSGMTRSSAGLDERRRRVLFRAWHRGTRELDLIMGRFADATLPDLDDTELTAFEGLMTLLDPDVYAWVTGELPVPPEHDSPLLRRLIAFHRMPRA